MVALPFMVAKYDMATKYRSGLIIALWQHYTPMVVLCPYASKVPYGSIILARAPERS